MNQYPREIAFMHGNMQHRAILIDNTQEQLNNNNNGFSNCFVCHQPAMSKPFYILDNTGFIIHASCTVITSARTIAGEHNRNIFPSHPPHPPHPPFNLHHQPPQYMSHYHSPPPNYNYLNGNFNAPYPPPYFNLHQQPPQCINYSYSAPPPHYVNCSNAFYPPPYPHYVVYPPPPPPQNIHNNHHHGYGGMLGMLGTSVFGNLIEAFFDSMLNF
ncbi:hypothetical protein IHE45_09G081200 [Dioscorea alata]|uniref:Uncharacterized protein n=1 Tax=Dioscorea alata TaxID=55571 RepID=A0ACB7VG10_DIOAL|nr:hypothetical protein IHE45_09G081200 [Dioscorea alata]